MSLSRLLAIASILVLASPAFAAKPRLPKDALPLPIVSQAHDYSCGAAALLSVLYYWKAYNGTETSLYPMLDTTQKDGTEPDKIAEVARELGLDSTLQEGMTLNDLRAALKRRDTVILDIQAWREKSGQAHKPWLEEWEAGHYVVLAGMDRKFFYVMDSAAIAGYTYLPIPELFERWHDYESRNGTHRRYFNTGIVIHGKTALPSIPAPLIRME
jgi:predicted double-glycine peptidase